MDKKKNSLLGCINGIFLFWVVDRRGVELKTEPIRKYTQNISPKFKLRVLVFLVQLLKESIINSGAF
jgi:hypothetical protein